MILIRFFVGGGNSCSPGFTVIPVSSEIVSDGTIILPLGSIKPLPFGNKTVLGGLPPGSIEGRISFTIMYGEIISD